MLTRLPALSLFWLALAALTITGPVQADDPTPEARKAAELYVDGAKARLLIGLEQDAQEVRKHKAEALAVPELAKLLKDKNLLVRQSAAMRLGLLKPAARAAVPALLDATKDDDAGVARAALAAVCSLAPLSKDQTAQVVEAWRRSKPGPFGEEVIDLGLLGADAVPPLAKILTGDDPKARLRLLEATVALINPLSFGPDGLDLIKVYVELLDSKEVGGDKSNPRRINGLAAQALGRVGPEAIPHVVKALGHPDKKVRERAYLALALNYRPIDIPTAVPAYTAMLKDSDENLRSTAADQLAKYGSAAKSAVPALIEAARQKESKYLPGPACDALGMIDPTSPEVLAVLIENLKADGDSRLWAARALTRAGGKAKDAAAPLREIVETRGSVATIDDLALVTTLAAIDRDAGKKQLPALKDALAKDLRDAKAGFGNPGFLRSHAVQLAITILLVEPDNKEALEVFVEASQSYEFLPMVEALTRAGVDVKGLTARLFKEIDWKSLTEADVNVAVLYYRADPARADAIAKQIVPVVGGSRSRDDARAAGAELLAEIGPKEGVVPALMAGLESYTPMVATAATRSLVKIGEPSVPALVKMLAHERPGMRYRAATILAELGPKASSAAPALRGLLIKDPYRFVATAAETALAKIGNK